MTEYERLENTKQLDNINNRSKKKRVRKKRKEKKQSKCSSSRVYAISGIHVMSTADMSCLMDHKNRSWLMNVKMKASLLSE